MRICNATLPALLLADDSQMLLSYAYSMTRLSAGTVFTCNCAWCQATSGAITTRVLEAEVTEASLTTAREHYRPAATRASTLYFVVADLAAVNSMCAQPLLPLLSCPDKVHDWHA